MTLPRGRAHPNGKHVVDYRHVIHSLRRKPMALLNLVYRDRLFPREAYAKPSTPSSSSCPRRRHAASWSTCSRSRMSAGCEAELAERLAAELNANRLPDLALLRAHFAPDPGRVPHVVVRLVPLDAYECLVGAAEMGDAA